jgi:glycosyltransferase involved in cell wall biosynthesis
MTPLDPRTSRPRRIALFTGNYVDVVDGVAKSTRRLASHLRDRGDDVRVFCPVGPDPAFVPGPEVFALPTVPLLGFGQDGYRYAFRLGSRTREALLRFDPDIIHVASPDRAAAQAIDWGRRRGVPVVGSFHTNFASYFRFLRGWGWLQPIAWRFVTRFYGRLDEFYVPTESMLEELRAHGLRTPAKIWSRGVDTERFSPNHRSRAWRRSMGVADDEVLVTFIARLYWEKGARRLAETLAALRDRGVPHRAMIVGEGPAESYLREALPNAIFTGFLEGQALSAAYASSDIFFYPSETDTFGNVTLEAMASGLPVVAADAPGTRCVVSDAASRLVSPGEPEAFVDTLEGLVCDAVTRRRLSRAAHQRAIGFAWTKTLDRMSNHYDDVIRRFPRHRRDEPADRHTAPDVDGFASAAPRG